MNNIKSMLAEIKSLTNNLKGLKRIEEGLGENLKKEFLLPPELQPLASEAFNSLKKGDMKRAGELVMKLSEYYANNNI